MNWAEVAPSPSLSGSLSTQLAVLLFAAVLGGGLFTGLANFIKARSSSKQVRLDTDPNSPRVAIGGAETAVTLMSRAMESLQKENQRLTERVDHLEKENGQLRAALLAVQDRLGITPEETP